MDTPGVVLSIVGMIVGFSIIFLLRKGNRTIALGLGGSTILGATVVFLRAYALVSVTSDWFFRGVVLLLMASFFYIASGKAQL